MAQTEIAKAIVDVDGSQAGAELKKLEERAKDLRNELSKLGKDNDLAGFRQKEKELKLVNQQMKNMKKESYDVEKVLKRLNGSSFNDLLKAQRALTSEIKRMNTNTKEEMQLYNQKIAKLKQVNVQLDKVKNEMHAASAAQGKWLGKAADGFNKYFGIVSAGIATFTGVAFSIKQLIQGNVELDDSLADVMKTTGLTKKEVRELYTEFNTLNTRTPKKELLALAEEAGRLGIEGKTDIMKFVDVANQIKVALGDDLGGNAEEAIREVGKLTNIFKVGEKYGVDFRQAMLMVGSSINEVSANSAADAPFLIEMSKRMAGVSSQAGISAQEIIGMAATLDEMGQTAEVSSTTLNKVIVNMFKDTETYAGLAGMGLQEFTTLLNKDANEALMKVLEGLNGNNSGLSTMAAKLDGLGLDGSRSVQVLAALASNIDGIRKNQDLANASLEKGTSLTNEYQVKNNNMAGSLEKIGRALKATFVSSGINEALSNMVAKVAKWVEIPVSQTMEDQRIKVNLLAMELANANTEEERRKKVYDELAAISPDIVEGLNQENINLEKLRGNLERYNDEAIRKIAIQRAQEDLNEINEDLGKQIEKRSEREVALNKQLLKQKEMLAAADDEIGKQAQEILISDMSTMEKYQAMFNLSKGFNESQKKAYIGTTNIYEAAKLYNFELDKENELIQESENALKKYQEQYQSIMGTKASAASATAFPVGGTESTEGDTATSPPGSVAVDKNYEKLLDQQAEFRMRVINESRSLIEQENIAYQERLKNAGLFGKNKEELTGQHLEAYQVLEEQHLENIRVINSQALSDEILENQKNFDRQTVIRQAAFNNEMAALGSNEEAKKALEIRFQREERERQQNFLMGLLAEMQQTIDEDQIRGIDEKLLTEEQKEALNLRIDEVKLKLSELAAATQANWFNFGEGEGSSTAPKAGKAANVDIFGMSSEDWANLINNIAAGELAIGGMIEAVGALTNAWASFYDIKNNLDQQDLQREEAKTNREKEMLQQRLDRGIIDQDTFNARSAALDKKLDAKRREVAYKAAQREKQIALMSAIINTASGVTKMLGSSLPPMNFILAAMVAAAGGLEIGKILTAPMPQFFSGKYDVLGAQDGKRYRAGVLDSPGTGVINSPSILVGEKPEIIIDPATTRNLQINYPHVLQAIAAARVPQYASGSYPAGSVSEKLPGEFYQILAAQASAINRLNDQLNRGIGAKLIADSDYMIAHNKVTDEYNDLLNQVNLRS